MLTRMHSALSDAALDELFAPISKFRTVGLAVSGGADSLALMILAQRWAQAQTQSPRFVVYTVDHGLRPEAAQEVELVTQYADELGLMVRALRWEGTKPKTGLQAAARLARYRLIGAAMKKDGAERLLTGHHGDDQAETVLMRMANGSGLTGLGGMRTEASVEGVPIVRPLLKLERAQLTQIVTAQGWREVIDPSNADPQYERVRWRNAMPALAELGLTADVIAKLSQRLRRADDALSLQTQRSFDECADLDVFGTVRLEAELFLQVPLEIQIRLAQMALQLAGDRRKPYALAQIEALVEKLSAKPFSTVTLSGCRIAQSGGQFVFSREVGRLPDDTQTIVPGSALVWDSRFEICNLGDMDVCVQPASSLTKKSLVTALKRDDFRMDEIGAAPVVSDPMGAILSVGSQLLCAAITIKFVT